MLGNTLVLIRSSFVTAGWHRLTHHRQHPAAATAAHHCILCNLVLSSM